MPLVRASEHPFTYEPSRGVQFKMRDGPRVIDCVVIEGALEKRGAWHELTRISYERLFQIYRSQIEASASRAYELGEHAPIVRYIQPRSAKTARR